MLFTFGVTFVVLGAVLTVASRAIFYNGMYSAAVRRWIAGESMSVALATLAGAGIVMVLLFFVGGGVADLGVVPSGLAVAIAVAGIFGVRVIHRRGGLGNEEAGLVAALERPIPAAE